MKLTAYARTDPGRTREKNEDFCLMAPDIGLFIVCDGLAVDTDGELAAKTAATSIHRTLSERAPELRAFQDTPERREEITHLMHDAVQVACGEVYRLGVPGMHARSATTMTLLLFLGQKALMAHVGDTRLYLKRGSRLDQLSEDHTYQTEMVKRGVLPADQARASRFAKVVTRALGQQEVVHVDTLFLDVLVDDTFLLCTDGLSRYIERSSELGVSLADPEVERIPDKLIHLALDRGGRDNVTVLVVRAETDEASRKAETDRTVTIDMQFAALKGLPLFQYLDTREILQLVQISSVRTFKAGQIVISEGKKDDSLYVALDGRLSIWRAGTKIAELERGANFGEMALLSSKPRSATVRSDEESKLLVLERAPLFEVIRRQPDLGVKVLFCLGRGLSERLDAVSLQLTSEAPVSTTPPLSELPFTLGA